MILTFRIPILFQCVHFVLVSNQPMIGKGNILHYQGVG